MDWTGRDIIYLALFVITVGGILIAVGKLIYSLSDVVADVKKLEAQMEETKNHLMTHAGDQNMHVNHLYMRTIEDSIKELKVGNKDINNKLDRIVDKLIDNPPLKRGEK